MHRETSDGRQSGWKGWLLMAACCVPMVAIVVLIALGFF
jgi:nitrate reductase NapE component